MALATVKDPYMFSKNEIEYRLQRLQNESIQVQNILAHLVEESNMWTTNLLRIADKNKFLIGYLEVTEKMEKLYQKLFRVHVYLSNEEDPPKDFLLGCNKGFPETDLGEPNGIRNLNYSESRSSLTDCRADHVEKTQTCNEWSAVATFEPPMTSNFAKDSICTIPVAAEKLKDNVNSFDFTVSRKLNVDHPSGHLSEQFQPHQELAKRNQKPPERSKGYLNLTERSDELKQAVVPDQLCKVPQTAKLLPGYGQNLPSSVPPSLKDQQFKKVSLVSDQELKKPSLAVLKIPQEIPEVKVPEVKELPRTQRDVIYSHGENPSNFWLQITLQELAKLSDNLQAHYVSAKNPGNFKAKQGMFCVALFKADDFWHRAKILQVYVGVPETAHIIYIDYGNTEVIETSLLRYLDPKFACLPQQAVNCCMHGVKPYHSDEWSNEAISCFLEKVTSQQLKAEFYPMNSEGLFPVELSSSFKMNTGEILNLNLAKWFSLHDLAETVEKTSKSHRNKCSTPPPKNSEPVSITDKSAPCYAKGKLSIFSKKIHLHENQLVIPPPHPLEKDRFKIMLSVIYSPTDWYAHIVDERSVLIDELQSALQEYALQVADQEVKQEDVVPGSCWITRFTDDLWYRVQVLHVQKRMKEIKCKVLFLDYGNRRTVSPNELKPLCVKLARQPSFAHHFSLALVTCKGKRWSEEARLYFSSITGFERMFIAEKVKIIENAYNEFYYITEVLLWDDTSKNSIVNYLLLEHRFAVNRDENKGNPLEIYSVKSDEDEEENT